MESDHFISVIIDNYGSLQNFYFEFATSYSYLTEYTNLTQTLQIDTVRYNTTHQQNPHKVYVF